jgi:hypothetical protein
MSAKPRRRMIPLIWLDEQDQNDLDRLQESLWATSKQDALLMSLRWACRRLESSPTIYRRYIRASNRPYADGKAVTIRMTEEQRQYLERFQQATSAESLTDAVRLLIRMAADHFSGE